jgi:hypothetical protein
MVALARLSLLRPPFTRDDREFLGAAHMTLQRIGFEAVLVIDPAQGEVIYVGPCIGETHWRAARTLGGDAVEITRIDEDRARFVGDRVVPTLRDALAIIIEEVQVTLAEVTGMATPMIARAA